MSVTLGTKLKSMRIAKALSRRKLSDLSGVTWFAISYIERDERDPKISTLLRLLSALGYTLSDLETWQAPPENRV